MLALRPNCECCGRDLPPDAADARARRFACGSRSAPSGPAQARLEPRASLCTFECTFCADCARSSPNCGGELLVRPRRPQRLLARYPAPTERVRKPEGCTAR